MNRSSTSSDITGLTGGAMRLAGRPNPALPQWWRTMRWMLGMQAYLAVWFWGVILVLEAAALLIFGRLDAVTMSYLQFAVHGTLWFPFAMMITITAAQLTVHVAAGMTRRSFAVAAVGTAAVMALGYGIVLAGGMVAEGALYQAMDWPHVHVANMETSGNGFLEPWTHGFATSAVMYAVRTFSGAVAGLLVGIGYYRYGPWRGTALLPLTALPALLGQDAIVDLLGGAVGWHPLTLALLGLVLPLLGALAYRRLTRSVPIRTMGGT
ncbi:hypothetical protein [Ruania alba]|uniref:Uncharacterized protein n=1 Tax=Ruania alba TaxID=648782 RepID=A0A1H5DZ87_9MICO|nr:hypothetical protein [Ruania alba]SED84086.1 hypothetical protein SAMN04488554_0840 [Ruania alba]